MNKKNTQFIKIVLDYYRDNGRQHLPWRKQQTTYRVWVSELMLQQTQAERVAPKYTAFMKQFPTVKALAEASLGEVLRAWQGLGYNRRAKFLHQCAQVVVAERHGRFPKTYGELLELPGIGPYTAAAIMAFAHNEFVSLIETNVRTVYLHHFFTNETDVTDQQILQLTGVHIDYLRDSQKVDARTWYAALMDYGSYIKKTFGNPNSRAKNYVKQSTFAGSDRQVRGAILRLLSEQPETEARLQKRLAHVDELQFDAQLAALLREGLVVLKRSRLQLPT